MGHDGVNYFFSCQNTNGRFDQGKIWSPGEKSKTAALTDLCEKCVAAVKKNRELTGELVAETNRVTKMFE
jgi:hypothetical protein